MTESWTELEGDPAKGTIGSGPLVSNLIIPYLGPALSNSYWLYDDFFYANNRYGTSGAFGDWTIGQTGDASLGTGAGAGMADPHHAGVVQFKTSTGTNDAYLYTGQQFFTSGTTIRVSFAFQGLDSDPTTANKYNYFFGLADSWAAPLTASNYGFGVTLVTNSGAQVIQTQYANGTSIANSSPDVQSAITADGWYFVELVLDPTLVLSLYVNGSPVGWIGFGGSAIPSNQGLGAFIGISKKAGTGARSMNVDKFSIYSSW